jgi:uncharacterized protein YjbJ (UPF0337 family)
MRMGRGASSGGSTPRLNPRRTDALTFAPTPRAGTQNAPSGNPAGMEATPMDNNRTEGTKREIKGAIKEVVGKVTGNDSKELAGNVEKNLGKVQRKAGEASDEIRDAARKTD